MHRSAYQLLRRPLYLCSGANLLDKRRDADLAATNTWVQRSNSYRYADYQHISICLLWHSSGRYVISILLYCTDKMHWLI